MLQKIELFYVVTLENVVGTVMAVINSELYSKLQKLMYAYQNITVQLLMPTRIVRWIQLILIDGSGYNSYRQRIFLRQT